MGNTIAHNSFASSFKDFKEITKAGLSISVVFSSLVGYLLGTEKIEISILLLLTFGGYFMVGASNVFNQIIERKLIKWVFII